MKSASVAVYKRPKALLQSPQKTTGVRIFVNKYASLTQKQLLANKQTSQKMRSRTARIMEKVTKQRKNAISSLNIISITTPQPNLLVMNSTTKKMSSSNIFNIKRNSRYQQNFMLKLPQNNDKNQGMQRMLIRASAKDIVKHAKVKLLTKIKCQKQVTLVISVDFVFNQFNFWDQEAQQVEQGAIQTWRLLSPLVNMIWLVRSQSTSKKLLTFTENKGLRLDGIIQVQTNKKQPLTISYYPLQKEINLTKGHKLLIINSLRTNVSQILSQFQFRNSLPIISHPSTFIHYVRINMHSRNRMNIIKKIVTQQLPTPYNINNIFEQYKEKKGKLISCKMNKQINIDQFDEKYLNVTQQLQKLKQTLLSYFQTSFGLRTKLDGDSLNYIIGDMIKRNYRIAKDYYKYCQQIELINKNKQKQKDNFEINQIINSKIKKIQYNRNVYVWQY